MLTLERDLDVYKRQLYEKETITGKEFMKIFREMKGLPQEEDKEALMPDDTEKDKKEMCIRDRNRSISQVAKPVRNAGYHIHSVQPRDSCWRFLPVPPQMRFSYFP